MPPSPARSSTATTPATPATTVRPARSPLPPATPATTGDGGHANHRGHVGLAPGHGSQGTAGGPGCPGAEGRASPQSHRDGGLAARLHHAVTLLPAPLGAPIQLLDLGRATRVVGPGLRRALAVRDGGCVAAGCDRPAPWTDAHHLVHWLAAGPTNVDNLVLLCRSHHRAVHEGGWRLDRTGGRLALIPPAWRQALAPAT